MEPNTIFVVTNIEDRGNHHARRYGWFKEVEYAILAVQANSGDMCEGQTNTWAVIEEITEGFPEVKAEHWFKWEGGEEGRYKHCLKPEFSKNLTNWGLG
jgi:hypothetical protein